MKFFKFILINRDGKAKYDSKKGDTSITKGFYGPPTNCKDLGGLGYNLNGYYMVKGKDESNSSKMQTVYCRFHQPQEIKLGKNLYCNIIELQIYKNQLIKCYILF